MDEKKPEQVDLRETLKRVSMAVTNQPLLFLDVDIRPKNKFQKLMQALRLFPRKRYYELRPITLQNLVFISERLLDINLVESSNMLERGYHALKDHTYRMAEIIAIALKNGTTLPDKADVEFVLENFDTTRLFSVMLGVLNAMGVSDFMQSITLIRGTNILQLLKDVDVKNVANAGVNPSTQGS